MKGFFSKLVKTRKGDTSGAESVAVGSVCEDPPRIVTFEVESNRPKTPGEIEEYEDEEIINTLINMAELIRIAKINKDLKGECITLRHLNKMLCQEYISTRALAEFLVLKSSWREEDGQTTRAEHKTRPKSKNAE